MSTVINTNTLALNSQRSLKVVGDSQARASERLSSGLRINRAADDAAGLAISEKMRSQVRGLDQASKNAQDGISLIQTAEGALSETHSIIQRMRELTVQASNDTITEDDRGKIALELNELSTEIDGIASKTEFNTKKLIDGSWKNSKLYLQTGANKDQGMSFNIQGMNAKSLGVDQVAIGDVISGKVAPTTTTTTTAGTSTTKSVTTPGTLALAATVGGAAADKGDSQYALGTAQANGTTKITTNAGSFTIEADGKLTISSSMTFKSYKSDGDVADDPSDNPDVTLAAGTYTKEQLLSDLSNTIESTGGGGKAIANFGGVSIGISSTGELQVGKMTSPFGAGDQDMNADDNGVNLTLGESEFSGGSSLTTGGSNKTISVKTAGATSSDDSVITFANIDAADIASITGGADGASGGPASNDEILKSITTGTHEIEAWKLAGVTVTMNDGNTFSFKSTAKNDLTMSASVVDGTVDTETTKDVTTITPGTSSSTSQTRGEQISAVTKVLDNALEQVSQQRAKLGAYQNRLEHTIKNLDVASENLSSAESRIRDTDMAKEMMSFTKSNVLSQAATSMLAQANQAPQNVLQLLR